MRANPHCLLTCLLAALLAACVADVEHDDVAQSDDPNATPIVALSQALRTTAPKPPVVARANRAPHVAWTDDVTAGTKVSGLISLSAAGSDREGLDHVSIYLGNVNTDGATATELARDVAYPGVVYDTIAFAGRSVTFSAVAVDLGGLRKVIVKKLNVAPLAKPNTPPTVKWTDPLLDGQTVSGTVTLRATGADAEKLGSVSISLIDPRSNVESVLARDAKNPVARLDTRGYAGLSFTVRATATDAKGLTASVARTLKVPARNTPPTIVWTDGVANNAKVSGLINLQATGADAEGLSFVALYLGHVSNAGALEIARGNPVAGNVIDTGAYAGQTITVSAVAQDSAGTRTIIAKMLRVKAAPAANTPPTVVWTDGLADGSTITGTVTLSAHGADAEGLFSVGIHVIDPATGSTLVQLAQAGNDPVGLLDTAAFVGSTVTVEAFAIDTQNSITRISRTFIVPAMRTPPTVAWTDTLVDGAVLSGKVTLSAHGDDAVGLQTVVLKLIDDATGATIRHLAQNANDPQAELDTAPYAGTTITVEALASNTAGLITRIRRSFTVNAAPTIEWTDTLTDGQTIYTSTYVSASSQDTEDGSTDIQVAVIAGDTRTNLARSDSIPPLFLFSIDPYRGSTVTLEATATDSHGAAATIRRTFVIANLSKPTIVWTDALTDGQNLQGTVTVSARATDPASLNYLTVNVLFADGVGSISLGFTSGSTELTLNGTWDTAGYGGRTMIVEATAVNLNGVETKARRAFNIPMPVVPLTPPKEATDLYWDDGHTDGESFSGNAWAIAKTVYNNLRYYVVDALGRRTFVRSSASGDTLFLGDYSGTFTVQAIAIDSAGTSYGISRMFHHVVPQLTWTDGLADGDTVQPAIIDLSVSGASLSSATITQVFLTVMNSIGSGAVWHSATSAAGQFDATLYAGSDLYIEASASDTTSGLATIHRVLHVAPLEPASAPAIVWTDGIANGDTINGVAALFSMHAAGAVQSHIKVSSWARDNGPQMHASGPDAEINWNLESSGGSDLFVTAYANDAAGEVIGVATKRVHVAR